MMRQWGWYGLFFIFLFLPFGVHAALVNINTADAELLDTLPGIGSVKANAIIDYRTIHGPFAHIQDIQNVTGIATSTYTNIAPFITVGSAPPPPPPSTPSTPAPSSPASSPSVAEDPDDEIIPPQYLIIPELHILGVTDRTIAAGADTIFVAHVYDDKNNRRPDATVTWTFGDGTRRIGTSVYHAYYAPGDYVLIVRATTPDGREGETDVVITAKDVSVAIQSVTPKGITLLNNDSRMLDLSGWRLSAGGKEFRIPADTSILGGTSTFFPVQVLQLPLTSVARLLYPNGDLASGYPPISSSPPAPAAAHIQKPKATLPVVVAPQAAPAVAQEEPATHSALAAAGEALVQGAGSEAVETGEQNLFTSPWFIGLLALIILAGVAFVFL
jgi:competence ComEA-like helix-hairpin-helix protein